MFGKASGRINNEVGLHSFHCSTDMLCILVWKEQLGMLANKQCTQIESKLEANFMISNVHIIKLTLQGQKKIDSKKLKLLVLCVCFFVFFFLVLSDFWILSSVMLWAHCRCAVKIFCIELNLIDLLCLSL